MRLAKVNGQHPLAGETEKRLNGCHVRIVKTCGAIVECEVMFDRPKDSHVQGNYLIKKDCLILT